MTTLYSSSIGNKYWVIGATLRKTDKKHHEYGQKVAYPMKEQSKPKVKARFKLANMPKKPPYQHFV